MPIEYTNRAANHVAWIIPARNQESGIGKLLAALPPDVFETVVVSDNGSSDRTGDAAYAAGATVVGGACLDFPSVCWRAVAALPDTTDAVLFTGTDLAVALADALRMKAAICDACADLVVDSHSGGLRAIRTDTLRALQTPELKARWMLDIPARARRKGLRVAELPLGAMSESRVSWTEAVRLWASGLRGR